MAEKLTDRGIVESEDLVREKVQLLIEKGVKIPNPLTVDIGEEVDIERISGEGMVIYAGCKIYGKKH
jgi:UDP-N-acetylglucosamine/UDP-N-acetylgalactosamine diphosphorylase